MSAVPAWATAFFVDFHAELDGARRQRDRRGEGIAHRRVGQGRHHAQVFAVRRVVGDMQVMKLVAAIVTDQARRLLEMRRLEVHEGRGAIAKGLLAPRHQALGEQAADGLAAVKAQMARPRGQAEDRVRMRRAQPLEIDRQGRCIEIIALRRRRERMRLQRGCRRGELRQAGFAFGVKPPLPPLHFLDGGFPAQGATAAVL